LSGVEIEGGRKLVGGDVREGGSESMSIMQEDALVWAPKRNTRAVN